ncbi:MULTISPECIES: hypothetical protein [Streptomyces]|uniref:hypothetical protein n=1 Tax=Streptomyces TaxID=1883 RepID=UPI001E324E60|nr:MULTISPECIES: hypothetical protein [Streptomyces]UFQ13611.1 hypothetical protein J2N69_00460 [Streptomyces huasconensis]WCL83208.1 hypothetical protein PPN52_00450 [Streptomyces sp. JCM 35825]
MRSHRKIATALAVGTLAAGLLTGGAGTASADVSPMACYDGAKNFSTTNKVWPAYPNWATTTTACADVNVKATIGANVQACFYQGEGVPHKCYPQRWLSQGVWDTAVTDVANGKKFYLKFDRNTSGKIAY